MAEGKIRYEDIFDKDVIKFIASLEAQIKSLQGELSDLQKQTQKDTATRKTNTEALQDSVDTIEDLLKLTQDELNLKREIKKAEEAYTKAVEEGSDAADTYAIAIKVGKEELSKMGFQIRNNAKLTLTQKGSMTELGLELAKNRMKYRELSQAERENQKVGG